MRLIRLEIEGFGPFKDKQEIDFAQFQEDGLFLIEGETGAGKSSILDAITFALYNFTARWNDSSANAVHKSVRSHYSRPTDISSVVLEFEVPAESGFKTFRITRTLGLDKDGNEDPAKQKVTLDEILQDGEAKTIGAKKTEVDVQIRKLLRLEPTEFLQVVLLAQGKFEAFLEAGNDERLRLIRKLFNTERFDKIQSKLKAFADAKKAGIEDLETSLSTQTIALAQNLGTDSPASGAELSWVETNLVSAKTLATDLEASLDQAQRELTTAIEQKSIADAQSEFADLNAELVELKKQEKSIASLAAKVHAGDRAAKVSGSYEAVQSAKSDFEDATAKLQDFDPDSRLPRELGNLRSLIAKANSTLGSLTEPLSAEQELPEFESELEAKVGSLKAATEGLASIELQIKALNDERRNLKPISEKLEERRTSLEEAKTAVQGLKDHEKFRSEIETLESEKNVLLLAETEAKNKYSVIFSEYKESQAGLLADDLHAGEECPVCGSTAHPKKAKHSKNVTEKELETARLAAEDARSNVATVVQKIAAAQDALKPLQKYASEKPSKIDQAFQKAKSAFDESSAAVARISEIAELVEGEDSQLVRSKAELTENRDTAARDLSTAQTELRTARELVAKSLGEFETVEAHSEWIEAQLAQLEELQELVAEQSEAMKAMKNAEVSFKKQLANQKFASPHAYLDAYLEDKDLEAIRSQVSGHQDSLNRVSNLLGQEKFSELPKKKVDLESAHETLLEAQSTRDEAKSKLDTSKLTVTQIEKAKKVIQKLVSDLGASRETYDLYRNLAETAGGKGKNSKQMSLEVYFAAAELETILEAANLHLSTMDAGDQFTLMHSDRSLRGAGQSGLGIEVMDDHTSRTRLPVSLSGGEKFQVSLAIALGLAQVVSERAGSIQVDTLFIDEGFGTLSGPVLESAMRTLDGLKQGGRMIGLISHVEKMKDEISAKVIVEKTPRGPSKVTTQI